MGKQPYYRKYSQSQSQQSNVNQSSQQPQQLIKDLQQALQKNDRYTNKLIYNISKMYKENVGVLRISLPESFTFNQNDIEEFFRKYGKIQNIIIKQSTKLVSEDQLPKKQQSIAYIIYSEYFSALLALRVLNSIDQKQRIITAKLCLKKSDQDDQLFTQLLIGAVKVEDMIIEVDEVILYYDQKQDYEFGQILNFYKYRGVIGLDLNDKSFQLKSRILGVQGCNFIRVQYACQKLFRFEHQDEQQKLEDLVLKLVLNRKTDVERQVLVLSNSLQKYKQAMKQLHELLQQIVEQYKNCKQKSLQIIPKDIHIRKWQKFSLESQLKFLNS